MLKRLLSGVTLDGFLALHEAIDEGTLRKQMYAASAPAFGFFFMLSLAAAIATFGLIANSAPAIIGAMIVAPLMSPIIGLSFSAITGAWRMMSSAAVAVILGIFVVVAIAFLCTKIFGLRVAGSEILARTAPTTLDLGVALCAGGAAAFAHARINIANSIAGVAIAVALVPPLAVCGIGLALGDKAVAEAGVALSEFGLDDGGYDVALGAFLLFATNIVGIVGIAMLVFLMQKYGDWRRGILLGATLVIATVLLLGSLQTQLYNVYVKNRVLRTYVKLAKTRPDLISGQGIIDRVLVTRIDGVLHVYIFGMGPRSGLSTAGEDVKTVRDIMSADIGEDLALVIEMIPVDVVKIAAYPPKAPEDGD